MKWITRERIRVNRTATCWLIRRFLDPEAELIFVAANQVESVQTETGATSFDAPGATYPHKDAQGLCSFAALARERLAHDPVSYWKWLASCRRRISRVSWMTTKQLAACS